MKDLFCHIDSLIKECFHCEQGKAWGLARLIKDDQGSGDDHYPITYDENPKKITVDDQFDYAWYHRLLNGSPEPSEEFSFGRRHSTNINQQVRTVLIIEQSQGDDVVTDFINAMPEKVEFTDYKLVEVSKEISLIRDHDQVWVDEWGISYKDKHQMRYFLYALEWTLEYIKCSECVTN